MQYLQCSIILKYLSKRVKIQADIKAKDHINTDLWNTGLLCSIT